MILSINGQMYTEKDAVISALDHGFLYGIGLFETFRTYSGEPFALDLHLERMQRGCRELGISWKPDERQLRMQISGMLSASGLEDAYIRYTITAGPDILGLPSGDYSRPTEVIYMKELPPPAASVRPAKALQLLQLRRNTPEGPVRFKSLHYMNNILAKREVSTYPWAQGSEGLMLTASGHVAEGIVSNLFWVKDEVLYTPSLETGILPGITRAVVIQLAEQAGIQVAEGLYTWNQAAEADEIFLTNSIQELTPVHMLYDTAGKAYPIHCPGPLTVQLQQQYRTKVGN
ncbi:aminodeoxychorismate lyase [Paenibacillus gansuensis]|uniref:Aminodeoxychorismate lyase n=1 Tax=Paenibacillus gansuensis TaxID=306542 RepID=A0ABW5P907_9BACL